MSTITYKQLSKALRRITALIKTPGLREFDTGFVQGLQLLHHNLQRRIKRDKKLTDYKPPKRSKHRQLMKDCDELRSKVVIVRAGYKSEHSGKGGKGVVLQDHHPWRKKTLWLRYDLSNSICLTEGEHFKTELSEEFDETIRWHAVNVLRRMTEDKAALLKHKSGKPDLSAIKLYLERQLKQYGG